MKHDGANLGSSHHHHHHHITLFTLGAVRQILFTEKRNKNFAQDQSESKDLGNNIHAGGI